MECGDFFVSLAENNLKFLRVLQTNFIEAMPTCVSMYICIVITHEYLKKKNEFPMLGLIKFAK